MSNDDKGFVLITGASEGIGRALAEVFARHGHNLVLTARNRARLESLAQELKSEHDIAAFILDLDLAEADGPKSLFEAVKAEGITIDILVNNAGFGLYGPFLERNTDEHKDLLQVNIQALTALCHLFGADMAVRGAGRILNVASTVAFMPGPLMATYFASKAFVLRFSESLREELRHRGVGVTCLCPGLTESRFHERAGLLQSNLLRFAVASAESVAEAGYRGCMADKAIVLPGLRNRLAPLAERLLPRALLRNIIHGFMARR